MGKRNVIILTLLFLTLVPLTIAYKFCDDTISEDYLEITEITDPSQTNEATWEWNPAESINIKVEARNKNLTARTFSVELYFLDDDLVEKNITTTGIRPQQTISIERAQTGTLNFSFQLNEPKQNTYFLYAKLFDPNNDTICTSLKATSTSEETTIRIKEEEKIIAVRNIKGPTNVTAGSYIEYITEIINLGNIKEDRILVVAYNADLGIREEQEIIDLEAEESKTVKFNFTIPANTTKPQEDILFWTEYDYNNETGHYYQSSEKTKTFPITISASNIPEIQINNTQNQTTQINESENQIPVTEIQETKTTYFWPILITTLIIIIIITATFFFLKYKKDIYMEEPSSIPTPASTYVKKIQEETSS